MNDLEKLIWFLLKVVMNTVIVFFVIIALVLIFS